MSHADVREDIAENETQLVKIDGGLAGRFLK